MKHNIYKLISLIAIVISLFCVVFAAFKLETWWWLLFISSNVYYALYQRYLKKKE